MRHHRRNSALWFSILASIDENGEVTLTKVGERNQTKGINDEKASKKRAIPSAPKRPFKKTRWDVIVPEPVTEDDPENGPEPESDSESKGPE